MIALGPSLLVVDLLVLKMVIWGSQPLGCVGEVATLNVNLGGCKDTSHRKLSVCCVAAVVTRIMSPSCRLTPGLDETQVLGCLRVAGY